MTVDEFGPGASSLGFSNLHTGTSPNHDRHLRRHDAELYNATREPSSFGSDGQFQQHRELGFLSANNQSLTQQLTTDGLMQQQQRELESLRAHNDSLTRQLAKHQDQNVNLQAEREAFLSQIALIHQERKRGGSTSLALSTDDKNYIRVKQLREARQEIEEHYRTEMTALQDKIADLQKAKLIAEETMNKQNLAQKKSEALILEQKQQIASLQTERELDQGQIANLLNLNRRLREELIHCSGETVCFREDVMDHLPFSRPSTYLPRFSRKPAPSKRKTKKKSKSCKNKKSERGSPPHHTRLTQSSKGKRKK